MLIEPDYANRRRMFEFVPKSLDELVPRDHLLRRVEACIDFRSLAAPLAKGYHPDHGRPAVPSEVLVRALAMGYLYGMASFRRLCGAIHENISFGWFLCLGLEDEVFTHSTISVFLRRVGGNGFRGRLRRLNEQLRRNGLLSDEAFVDSTLPAEALRPTFPSTRDIGNTDRSESDFTPPPGTLTRSAKFSIVPHEYMKSAKMSKHRSTSSFVVARVDVGK